jgi:hypothetical protein
MSNPFKIAGDASKLSITQLQQALQNGTVPPYIGIPLLQDMVQKSKQSQAMAGGQQKPPTVAQQVMAQAQQAQGVPSLETNLPQTEYAAGGIVAFAGGDLVDDETDYEEYLDNARTSEINDLMDEYAQTFEQGIGSLPEAKRESAPTKEYGSTESTPDFIARIMHKESRGQRYGKDGQLLRSEKGALGEMQVMPGTNRDPGYGVKAARDSSPDEMARVGRDYATAMLQRYGDPKLAAIAYNMGPGATDKWLAAGADMSKLPRETQGYVKGFAEGGAIRFQNRGEVKEGIFPNNSPDAGKFSYTNAAKTDPFSWENIKSGIGSLMGSLGTMGGNDLESLKAARERYVKAGSDTSAIDQAISKLEGKGIAAMQKVSDVPAGGPDLLALDAQRRADAAKKNTVVKGPTAYDLTSDAADQSFGPISREVKQAAVEQQEAKVDPFAEFRDMFRRREEGVAKQREQDKYMALLSAGLGMMGGTSPNALANIGAGGQQGIQSLMASNKDRAAEENALLAGRLGLAKIGASQAQAEGMMKLRQDMQKQALAQRDAAQAAALEERRLGREDRGQDRTFKLLSDIEDKARAAVAKDIAGNIMLQNNPNIETIKEQMIQDRLRSHKTYGRRYKEHYGEDPFEIFGGSGGGGGTRMKFDAKGNQIK